MMNYNKVNDSPTEAEKTEVADDRKKYWVSYPGNLNFRKYPGGNILFELKPGEEMAFVGDVEEYDGYDWLKMEARGKTGFVMSKYVEPLEEDE